MVVDPRRHVNLVDGSQAITELYDATTGIVANAGGGQANATQLVTVMNRVSTVATIGDSVKLPAANPGASVMVANRGANSMNVFPQSGQSINALAGDAAFAMAAGATALFFCAELGKWETV